MTRGGQMHDHRSDKGKGEVLRQPDQARTDRAVEPSPQATAALITGLPGQAGRRASGSAMAGPPLRALTRRRVMQLQGSVGNRTVSSVMGAVAQRIPMTTTSQSETLYNQTNAAGQATAKSYGGGVDKYDMTRVDDTSVTVTVRIKFLSQARNTVDPAAPGAPAGTPRLGALLDSPTEIPADDPDNRRAWATEIASNAVVPWNGRLTLVEGPAPAAPAPGTAAASTGSAAPAAPAPAPAMTPPGPPAAAPKRLPVTFAAVPVFRMGDPEDARIIVHPMSTVAGTPGQPIDAGNYYQNKGSYTDDDKVIAAHEYGHLLGIPDEYSQSNSQLNALIHQAAPGSAPSAGAALDRETVQRMVLNSLKQPLYDALTSSLAPVTTAMLAHKAKVKKALVAAAKAGVVDSAVTDMLAKMLLARSESKVTPSIPGAVAFETTRNFSSRSIASGAIEAGFSAQGLALTIGDAYWRALGNAEDAAVAVAGVGDVTINSAGSVAAVTAAGGAQAAPAAAVATKTVSGPGPAAGGAAGAGGPAPGGGGTPGLPAIAPPPTLVSQLTALPATWDLAGSQLETGITPAAFAKAMEAALKSADAASIVSNAMLPPARRRKKSATVGAMYQRAYQMVQLTAKEAATQVTADLVGETVKPTLTSSVTELVSTIDAEVKRIMTTPPSGIAALGPPDPNMAALVSAMKATLDANKAATAANPGRDPLGRDRTGVAAAQDVTYSAKGMMGSNATRAIRSDQFAPIVDNFNAQLLNPGEDKFRANVT